MDPTRSNLRLAARQLGALIPHLGDFYDVIEEIAIGWAEGLEAADAAAASAVYTSLVESGPGRVAGGEAVFAAAQEEPAPAMRFLLRSQLAALNELRSVAGNVMEWRVEDARASLWSWSEVGEALEISKQAAQQRFGGMTREDAVAERYARLSDDDV